MRPICLFSISSHPDAISINSLDITFFKPDIDFAKYDALIITSKQASKALKAYEKSEYIKLPALAISLQSAKAYEAIGGKILGIGQGYGDTLASKIKAYSKEMRWLYLRAKLVASDFVAVCKQEGYSIDEAVVYESRCSQAITEVKVPDEAVLIFTSPSSVECFLQNHTITPKHTVVVIGKTTAKALPLGIKYILSKDKTIGGCFAALKKA
jgi:uroporphyrinogen-III synthase